MRYLEILRNIVIKEYLRNVSEFLINLAEVEPINFMKSIKLLEK